MFWLAVDVIGALALLGAGLFGLATWRGEGSRWDGTLYWALAGFGLVFLAVDERFSLHERVGRRLDAAGFSTPAGVNHTDDLVLLALALAGLAVTLAWWREVSRHSEVLVPLLAGLGLFGVALGIDMRAPVEGWAPAIEESLEFGGSLVTLVALRRRFSVPLPGP